MLPLILDYLLGVMLFSFFIHTLLLSIKRIMKLFYKLMIIERNKITFDLILINYNEMIESRNKGNFGCFLFELIILT